ncbi:TBC1 domain family member 1-like isoform X2 [Symsagittifera roscoffensis]|uniref:TBC1 domain family member 1-like isoform X2 n=1 Tax=Symsagittifera roscoffensis TaxID=84072 RepID=UPI00307B482F
MMDENSADNLSYLGTVTLTPYHTQTMLPWILAEMQSRSTEAGAKIDCTLDFDETNVKAVSQDDGTVVLSHPILSISRFVHPRTESVGSGGNSKFPSFAYIERDLHNGNSYKIHAFQCFNKSQIESYVKLLNSALEGAFALKSEREISGNDFQSALTNSVFKLVAVGPVNTKTLTSLNVDEIITSRLPGGPKNFQIVTHLRMMEVATYIRTGSDHFYIVSSYNTAKQTVVARRYTDVTGCSLGKTYSDGMAIVCRENNTFVCYCLVNDDSEITFMISQKLQELIKQGLKRLQSSRATVCSQCPMNAFHELCRDLEKLDDTSINSAIRTKFESILTSIGQFGSNSNPNLNASFVDPIQQFVNQSQSGRRLSVATENGAMMALLRQHFESMQQTHQHVFGSELGNNLKGGFFDNFNKAKKAMQGSLQEMKHVKNEMIEEASRNTTSIFTLPQKAIGNGSNKGLMSTPKNWKEGTNALEHNLKVLAGRMKGQQMTPDPVGSLAEEWLALRSKGRKPSLPVFRGIPTWRQDIYTLVTTPVKKSTEEPIGAVGYANVLEIPMDFSDCSPLGVKPDLEVVVAKVTKRDYKAIWKRAILDQILLIRMEKANSTLKACQDWVAHRRCKLDFDDSIGGLRCPEELGEVWQDLLNQQSLHSVRYDYVYAAVKSGIPKLVRGEAWKFLRMYNMQRLRESHGCRKTPDGQTLDSNCNLIENDTIVTPLSTLEFQYNYESLIRKKSKHQNDIFLDLDRTFPTHPFFAEKYGIGQLALYNVLRAYSIIDDDVGYCQGMSFVASVLLMHLTEEESFEMLRYLMQALNLRRQYRPPNMTGLQVKQYQLQRLLHDRLPRLHSHLQKLEIPPTLYATAWFLTLFSSQFPLGLVIRLFDLILLEGPDVVFKVAIFIFTKFEGELLAKTSFEGVINWFKTSLPTLVAENASDIIKSAFDSSFEYLNKQLFAYEVEYQVMREEEIINSPSGVSKLGENNLPKSETSSDIANSRNDYSGRNSGSSLQKHNEFCLEKVAALNKKLEKDNYALELKTQHLRSHSYELQDQVASLQKEECKLHSALLQLAQERESLKRTVEALCSELEKTSRNPNVNSQIPLSSTVLADLQLSNLDDILPEKLASNLNQSHSNSNVFHPPNALNGDSLSNINSSKYYANSAVSNNSQAYMSNFTNGSSF